MKTIETQKQIVSPGRVIAGGCVLVAVVGLFVLSGSFTAPPTVSAPPAPTPPVEKIASSPSWASAAESRVTFAHTMPRGQGSQVFNNEGTPNLDMIMVAIPDGPKKVRFVRGNTPEAVRYLAETKVQQELILVDHGPADVDTSEITNYGPLKGRTTRRVRVGADPK